MELVNENYLYLMARKYYHYRKEHHPVNSVVTRGGVVASFYRVINLLLTSDIHPKLSDIPDTLFFMELKYIYRFLTKRGVIKVYGEVSSRRMKRIAFEINQLVPRSIT